MTSDTQLIDAQIVECMANRTSWDREQWHAAIDALRAAGWQMVRWERYMDTIEQPELHLFNARMQTILAWDAVYMTPYKLTGLTPPEGG